MKTRTENSLLLHYYVNRPVMDMGYVSYTKVKLQFQWQNLISNSIENSQILDISHPKSQRLHFNILSNLVQRALES